ncbi:hypothetical protein [Saccharomonospora viridis]|nr:hypothetical protein [Saccharomonospora viridis]
MGRDEGKTDASAVLHESTLGLPWSKSGMHIEWDEIPHITIDLSVSDVRDALEQAEDVRLAQHDWAVLLFSASSPATLCRIDDALDDFDEILAGPGFIFGADRSEGSVTVHTRDLAYYDGADRLFFLVGDPRRGHAVGLQSSDFNTWP